MGRGLRPLPIRLYAIHASTTGCIAGASGAPVFNRGTMSNLGFELLHILLKVELKGVPMVYPLYLDFDGFSR